MKKKILLAALFSVTAVLAVIGLATEKSNAKGWYGDDPIWMETGESLGMPTPTTVYCNETVVRDVWNQKLGYIEHQRVTMSVQKEGVHCAMISTGACTPYSPC